MISIFDERAFNERLFFPRAEFTPAPPNARDVFIEVDGARLHARVHEPNDARAALLLFHGNGEVVTDYDTLAHALTSHGVWMAIVDYRGYGRSSGTPTLRAMLADVPVVIDALGPALGRGNVRRVVQGRSLGGLCAAEAVRTRRDVVDAFVFESAPADLIGLIRRRGLSPPRELTPDDRAAFDPCDKLRAYAGPLLVLHGASDTLIDPREGEALLAAATGSRRRMVRIAGRGHNDLLLDPTYWDALRTFIHEV